MLSLENKLIELRVAFRCISAARRISTIVGTTTMGDITKAVVVKIEGNRHGWLLLLLLGLLKLDLLMLLFSIDSE